MIDSVKIAVTTTGSDGSASGTGTAGTVVNGRVLAIHLDYHSSAPATTDVTVATTAAPTVTILTVTDNKTDGWYYPRVQVQGTTGTGLTYDGTRTVNEAIPVCDNLTVSVAQANALTNCVVATIVVER